MGIKKHFQKFILPDLIYMLIFGGLSLILGFFEFEIPGVEGGVSDLREIPLLISVFYIRNPLFLIGAGLLTSFGTPPEGSFISTLSMHSIALLSAWFFYRYIKKRKLGNVLTGISWSLYTFAYYLLFMIPVMILTYKILNLTIIENNQSPYFNIVSGVKFEIISTSFISALYLVQFKVRKRLKEYKNNLEYTVKERTEELVVSNEQFKKINVELRDQTEELSVSLQNLKNAQNQLIHSEKMASIGTLTAGIAHEINNPLNFISGGITLLDEIESEISESLPKEQKNHCKNADKLLSAGLENATNIVKSLMSFSAKGKPALEVSNINKIIDNTLLFLNSRIFPGIKVEKKYKLNKEVPVFQEKINQIIYNLINNAIYAVNQKDDKNEKIITVLTFLKRKTAFISISNNGPNIPEDHMDQVFVPFFTTNEPGKSAGLGLSICNDLIKEHKGKISVRNNDKGVSFIIEIPILNID